MVICSLAAEYNTAGPLTTANNSAPLGFFSAYLAAISKKPTNTIWKTYGNRLPVLSSRLIDTSKAHLRGSSSFWLGTASTNKSETAIVEPWLGSNSDCQTTLSSLMKYHSKLSGEGIIVNLCSLCYEFQYFCRRIRGRNDLLRVLTIRLRH